MDIHYNHYELTNNVNLRYQKKEIKEEKPEPENVVVQENEIAKPEKAMKSSEVIEFFNRAMVNNKGENRGEDSGNAPVGGSEEPEPAKGNPFFKQGSDDIVIDRGVNGDTEYNTILNLAKELNKQLWGRVNLLLEQYDFDPIDDLSDVGDNNIPQDDHRFILLRELGEKLSPEEWKDIKIMVDRLLELLSKAHELNNFDMDGEENNLKHPVQFGIIVNIIDPFSWKYE